MKRVKRSAEEIRTWRRGELDPNPVGIANPYRRTLRTKWDRQRLGLDPFHGGTR